ncbi:MAG: hypothetical protein R3E02_08840 [Blastomonas sp.]
MAIEAFAGPDKFHGNPYSASSLDERRIRDEAEKPREMIWLTGNSAWFALDAPICTTGFGAQQPCRSCG